MSEKLFRLDVSKPHSELQFLSYEKKGTSRGKAVGGIKLRGDESSVIPPMFGLVPGLSVVTFINSITFSNADSLPSDCDYIPAMSIVELTIAPKNSDNCEKGRGLNVKSFRPSLTTIDAYLKDGAASVGFPSSAVDAKSRAEAWQDRYPAILNDIETEKLCFMVEGTVLKRGYMGEIECEAVEGGESTSAVKEFVKLFPVSGDVEGNPFTAAEYVDIPTSILQKQTNTSSNEHACAMLDLAMGVGALTLVTTFDARLINKGLSPYRALPVIDTAELFACLHRVKTVSNDCAQIATVDSQGDFVTDEYGLVVTERVELQDAATGGSTLTLSTGKDYDGGKLFLTVNVDKHDLAVVRPTWDLPQKNNALALVGPGVKTSAGYFFRFDVINESIPDVIGVVAGYINRSSGSSIACKKRKLVSMSGAF